MSELAGGIRRHQLDKSPRQRLADEPRHEYDGACFILFVESRQGPPFPIFIFSASLLSRPRSRSILFPHSSRPQPFILGIRRAVPYIIYQGDRFRQTSPPTFNLQLPTINFQPPILAMTQHHRDICNAVSAECPVSATLYGYYPNLGANAFFAALFGLLLVAQLIIGTWTRTWTFMFAVSLGIFGEMVGYIGRLIMHRNPWSDAGFETQICCLVLAPSFLAAGIYLTLKHMVLYCGPEYSRLKAKWYPRIFIGSDLASIIVQAIGGGVAASAKHSTNRSLLTAGDALIIAGIALQSVTMGVCGVMVLDFFLRRRKARTEDKTEAEGTTDTSLDATTLTNDVHTRSPLRFRIFCWAIGFAFFTILIRCLYRIPEMAGGWGNPRMRDEPVFLGLDGGMVALASIAFTVAHPGFMFSPMRKGKKAISS